MQPSEQSTTRIVQKPVTTKNAFNNTSAINNSNYQQTIRTDNKITVNKCFAKQNYENHDTLV